MGDAFDVRIDRDDAVIELLSILDMSAADDFHEVLLRETANHQNLSLDAKAVERMSTPCIQVLLAAAREIEGKGGAFKIKNASNDFVRAIEDLGLAQQLKKWSEA